MCKWDVDDESAEPSQDLSRYYATLSAERDWRRRNADLWRNEVEQWALNEAAAGRKFSIQTAMERIRWKDRVDDQGDDVKVNDHWGPIWSRLLVVEHPELAEYIVQKKTPWDGDELRGLIRA